MAKAITYNYQGKELPLYNVPTSEGMKRYALVKGYREDSDFVDPEHPEKGVFNWKGRYRTLDPVYEFSPTLDNFEMAWNQVNFALLFRNTFAIAIISTLGTLISSILVAYGFARFPIPGKNIIFVVLIRPSLPARRPSSHCSSCLAKSAGRGPGCRCLYRPFLPMPTMSFCCASTS
jgi:multiple sugar transport system permease protein